MTPDLLAYLRTLPGRCLICGAHKSTQPHHPDCKEAK